MQTLVFTSYKCEVFRRPIIGENENSVLFPNVVAGQPCTAKDLNCRTKDGIIVWNENIVHKCPYEFIQEGIFELTGAIAIDRNQSILFQIINNKTECDMVMLESVL